MAAFRTLALAYLATSNPEDQLRLLYQIEPIAGEDITEGLRRLGPLNRLGDMNHTQVKICVWLAILGVETGVWPPREEVAACAGYRPGTVTTALRAARSYGVLDGWREAFPPVPLD